MFVIRRRLRSALLSTLLAAAVALTLAQGAAAAGASVSILSGGTTGFHYMPAKLSVVHGTKVTWTNRTTAPHTVTRCTPAACAGHSGGTGTTTGFGSSTINPNGTYSFNFTGKGTYLYYCAIHGYAVMHGSVSVT